MVNNTSRPMLFKTTRWMVRKLFPSVLPELALASITTDCLASHAINAVVQSQKLKTMLSFNLSEYIWVIQFKNQDKTYQKKNAFLNFISCGPISHVLIFMFFPQEHKPLLSTPVSSQRGSFCDLYSALLSFHTFNCQDHHDTAQPCPRAVK